MSGLNRFDEQLKEALRPVAPPAGLEQRILRRVEGAKRPARLWWLSVAASVAIVAGASIFGLHWREERLRARQAEQSRQQLELAIQITSRTLAKAEARLRTIGVERIEVKEVSQ